MSIGRVWALCEINEKKDGRPTTAREIQRVMGVSRAELRLHEHKGRLDVYYVTDDKGTRQKAYMRPKGRG
jgi:hypothetical protein